MGRRRLGLSWRDKVAWRRATACWMRRNADRIICGYPLREWVRWERQDVSDGGELPEEAQYETHEQYCTKMGTTARYGGHPEILAFTKQDSLNAWVWQPIRGQPNCYVRITKVDEVPGAKRIHLCHSLRKNHYDLLEPENHVFDEDDVAAAFNGAQQSLQNHPDPAPRPPLGPPRPPSPPLAPTIAPTTAQHVLHPCSCICTQA